MVCKRARLKGRAFFVVIPYNFECCGLYFCTMKTYKVEIEEVEICDAVYNITANAAAQRGDAAHVATEDNKGILEEFLEKGKVIVAAALGRYGNGLEYSMPDNWNYKDEIDERVNAFLVDYVVASWMGLSEAVEVPILELMSILNKRNKPL